MFELQPINFEIQIKGFHSIYYFEFGKDFTHIAEKHDFWEMVYVDSGRIITVTDGVENVLRQGQVIFHEPMEEHAHISDEKTPNNMLVISFSTDSEAMKFFAKKTMTLNKTAKDLLSLFIAEANDALGRIPGDYNNKNALDFSNARIGATQLLSCYFSELLINLIRNETNAGGIAKPRGKAIPTLQSPVTQLVVEYLKENVYASLTLDDICAYFMQGKSWLCAVFKQNEGDSIMEYFSKLKIAEAKKLLRSGNYSVGQISDMLGFSCIHTFSRAFKQKVGFSPLEYKKSVALNTAMEQPDVYR